MTCNNTDTQITMVIFTE